MINLGFEKGSAKILVAWNTVSQLMGKFVSALTSFLITLLVAQRFGALGYGDFVKVTTYVAFFYLISDFGVNAVFLQKTGDKEQTQNWWSALLGLRLVAGVLLVFVALAVLSLIPPGQEKGYTNLVRIGIIIFAPSIIFQALLTSANAIFQKYLRYDLSTMALILGNLLALFLVWLIVNYLNNTTGILFVFLATLLGILVTAIVAFLSGGKLINTVRFNFSGRMMSQLLVPCVPLGLTLIFNLVYFHADSVILTLTRPTSEVGIYGLAYKVFETVLVVPTFFMNAVYPLMVRIGSREPEIVNQEFKKIFKKSFLFLLLVSCLLFVVMWLVAPLLTLIKTDFSQSIAPLMILSAGLPIFFLSSLTMWTLVALKKQWSLVWIYGFSMIVNIGLNVILIPSYGYLAAAVITVLSEVVVLLLSGFYLARSKNFYYS